MGHNIVKLAVAVTMGLTGMVVAPASPVRAASPLVIIVDTATGPDSPDACANPLQTGCTLPAAVAVANDHPGSTIYLQTAIYALADSLTIGADGTTIEGAGPNTSGSAADFVIDANGGQGFDINADDVTIRGVWITGAANGNRSGGAINVRRNTTGFLLEDSEIVGNSAREGAGVQVTGSATIRRSTFENNVAERKGGAVRVEGTLEMVNSTFTGNTAQSGGAVSVAGTAAISFSTFVDNTSNNEKGAGVDRNGGTVYITGSILTRANQQSADGSDCSGNPDLVGPNYVGNAQGCNPDESVLIGTDPAVGPLMLPPLADNLGPTRTIRLSEGSVAIDDASAEACRKISLGGVLDDTRPAVAIDQRGFGRPSGDGCDLGAYELTPLTIGLELTADTDTPYVGARFLPSSAIAESVIATDSLFRGSLEASPLNAFPLESAPLNAFPLNAFPLNAFPLNAFPLNAFFAAAAPLNAFPLNAFPLNAFPLNAFPLSDLVLTDGTWDDLLAGTAYEGVPLQSLTLDDVQDVAGVQALSLGQLNLEGTPLNAFPLNAFLLSSVPLNAFPLNAFDIPEGGTWCNTDAFTEFCAAGGVDPADDSFTLASAALAGVPLNAFPLNAFPLNAFPLNAFPLNAFPLNAFPLNAFAWTASPLNAFPLNAFPLNAFDDGAVVDCLLLPGQTCDGATLLDAYLAGALAGTLGDLGNLFLTYPDALAALGEFTLADLLIGLIPSESIAWNEVDLTVPGIQNAAPAEEWTFRYLANLALTTSASSLTLDLELPPGFAYVPGGSTLDGVPVADPTLSCPDGSCVEPITGDPLPITLTFELPDVPAGNPVLSVATRAGFELGTFIATAEVTEAFDEPGDTPVTAGPSSYTVDVIAPPDSPTSPVIIETAGTNPCLGEGIGDVNLGWIASTTDGIDFYRFDISPEAAACGVRADIFMSNLPVDLDLTLYGQQSVPLRGEPTDSIPYLDDVTLDLNPFDDVIQADTVQDIPQVLPSGIADPAAFAVAAISSNRDLNSERIRTGTLREGTYFLQVTGYNGAEADTPYALRLRIDGTVAREPCAALPYPGVGDVPDIAPGTLPLIDGDLPTDLNTLFLANTQLLEFTYDAQARTDLLAKLADDRWADAGVIGAALPVDADPDVQVALQARAGDPCDPERSNDVVRAIGDLIDTYTAARPGIEYIVIIGDDRQIAMANIVDDANFANERTFAQEFANDPNNESIAALAAGRYRTDDPYGTDAGIRVRDHELFVPTRAVGRVVETPTEILTYLENFLIYQGQLDPDTEQRTALQTGYEFLTDGAELNAGNLTAAGFDVDDTLIGDTWTDGSLESALTRSETDPHLDLVGIHAHFDENNALPAFDNFNPPVTQDELFSSDELPANVDRAVVYSMGCHSGYSLSDIQIGVGPGTDRDSETAPDWAQVVTGERTNAFLANTGFGYGDTDRIALTEQLTAIFADEVTREGAVGQAWVNAKQRFLSEILVLDAYQEKSVQQFVLYGLPMFRVGAPAAATTATPGPATLAAPDTDPVTGQPIATLEVRGAVGSTDPAIGNFQRFDEPDGSYYALDNRAFYVNGHPIQPLYAETAPAFDGLEARDALITDMTSVDVSDTFDPLFFWASPNFGGPRPEYFDGSWPAEMAAVRSFELDGEPRQQVLIAAGQFKSDDVTSDFGIQRLHTRVETEVYYSDSDDFTAPTIIQSTGAFDDDAIRFEVDVEVTEAEALTGDEVTRVYVLYRKPPAIGAISEWVGLDLALGTDGLWRGVGPFQADADDTAEFIVQAIDSHGNVAMSNNKSQYFLEAARGDISNITLTAQPLTGQLANGWYTGDVLVTVEDASDGSDVFYRVDAGAYLPYPTGGFALPATDTGAHIVTAYDTAGGFDALIIQIDSVAPIVSIARSPSETWSNEDVEVTITADDEGLSGIARIRYSVDGGTTWTTQPLPVPPATEANQAEQVGFTISTDGVADIVATATDVAGNTSGEATATVRIDAIAPVVTISRTPDEVWSNEPVTVTVDATDDRSGIAEVSYSMNDGDPELYPVGGFVVDTDGITTISASATDLAGNVGTSVDDVVIQIDTADPVVPTLIVAPTVNIGQNTNATYSCGDDLSGVASCEIAVTDPSGTTKVLDADLGGGTVPLPTGQLGSYTVTVTVLDRAGNDAVETAPYVVVDPTPPEATVSVAASTVPFGGVNTVTFGCTDGESGIATCGVVVTRPDGTTSDLNPANAETGTNVPVPTSQSGAYTVTVTATDLAGNDAVATAEYTVDLCVNPLYDPTQAKKAGSNYTIKIELCDAAGNNISSRQITLTAILVTKVATGDEYEPGINDSGNANGGNAELYEFRYSNRKGYIYNLDTTGLVGEVDDPTSEFTLDFVAEQGGVVLGIGHAPFTLVP